MNAPDQNTPERDRVLLVDDDDSFRETYARLLRQFGYDCLCAPDVASAISLLAANQLDALIADLYMPGDGGFELADKATAVTPNLPIIFLTGAPSVETAARSVRLAVVAYLVKPPVLEELLSLLRQVIPRYRHLRLIAANRQHLQQWMNELTLMEDELRRPRGMTPKTATQDHLRVSLQNLILQLSDLDRSITAWRQLDSATSDLREFDLVSAIRHTVGVLEKTRQNFHSKDLGELRKQLERLLPPP